MPIPAEYDWIAVVLNGAAVIFISDLIGNTISFSNRFVNALVTSIVYALIFGAFMYYFGLGT